jgi:hypothetical protein
MGVWEVLQLEGGGCTTTHEATAAAACHHGCSDTFIELTGSHFYYKRAGRCVEMPGVEAETGFWQQVCYFEVNGSVVSHYNGNFRK